MSLNSGDGMPEPLTLVCDLGLAGADKGRNVNLSLGGQVVSGLDVTRVPPFEAGDWKEESQVQILGGVTVQ